MEKRQLIRALFIFGVFLIFQFRYVFAQDTSLIILFYSPTCPHCIKEKEFLGNLQKEFPHVKIQQYESGKHIDLMDKYYEKLSVPKEQRGFVPFTIVGNKYFVGFNEKTTGEDIKSLLKNAGKNIVNEKVKNTKDEIKIPVIGLVISRDKTTLPALAMVLGFLDGFNICSLGALLLILTLVLTLKSRFQTLFFGSIFILTTSFIYGFLIVAWYRIFVFLTPIISMMETILGLIMIIASIYFFSEFLNFLRYGPTCKISLAQKIEAKFSKKFKRAVDRKNKIILLAVSVFIFASVVTIIEFPCSAAVPVAFAGILSQSDLFGIHYLFLIFIYTFFYMFDEIAVFISAFITTKLWLTSPKLTTWITFIQSFIMLVLGSYYLIK